MGGLQIPHPQQTIQGLQQNFIQKLFKETLSQEETKLLQLLESTLISIGRPFSRNTCPSLWPTSVGAHCKTSRAAECHVCSGFLLHRHLSRVAGGWTWQLGLSSYLWAFQNKQALPPFPSWPYHIKSLQLINRLTALHTQQFWHHFPSF